MKKQFLPLFAAAVLSLSACHYLPEAKSESDIRSYLSDNGIAVTGTPKTKEIYIPEEFGSVYENYNELQKSQGFNLYDYRGREAELYTYNVVSVHGENRLFTEAHVIICGGRIIGGDVASTALDGEMTGISG